MCASARFRERCIVRTHRCSVCMASVCPCMGVAQGVFITCSLLSLSAASFSSVPMWALTHARVHPHTLQFRFSNASAVFNAIADLKSILSSDFSVLLRYPPFYGGAVENRSCKQISKDRLQKRIS